MARFRRGMTDGGDVSPVPVKPIRQDTFI